MAAEAEIERMVVRIVGDTADYQKSLEDAQRMTQAAAGKMGGVQAKVMPTALPFAQPVKPPDPKQMDGFLSTLNNVNLRSHETRKSLILLGATGIISPEASHSVFLLAEGLSIAKSGVSNLIGMLFSLRGALMATGIGLLVVAIGAAVGMLAKMADESAKAREASESAFQSIATGARTAQQALKDVKVNTLTEGMKELHAIMNPGWFQAAWDSIKRAAGVDVVGTKIEDIEARTRTAQANILKLTTPIDQLRTAMIRARNARIGISNESPMGRQTSQLIEQELRDIARIQASMRELARERNLLASSDVAQSLEEEAARSSMAAREAKRYAEAQRDAREGGISLAESLNRLAASHNRQRTAELTADLGRMELQIQSLSDEADRASLSPVNAQIAGMAQEIFRANPWLGTFENAMAAMGNRAERVRDQLNRASFNTFTRNLRDQINTFGLSSERAELFRMSMNGVSDANIRAALSEVRHLEALRALQAPLERIEGVRSGSVEALHRQAEYERSLQAMTLATTARGQLLQNQQQGQAGPPGQIMLAGQAGAAVAAQQAFQVAQIQNQIPQAGAAAGQPGGGFGPGVGAPGVVPPSGAAAAGIAQAMNPQETLLREIRDLLSSRLNPPMGQAPQPNVLQPQAANL